MQVPERVVITGMAAVCGLGRDLESIWAALRAGRSAVRPIRQWEATGWTHRHAAEIADEVLPTLIADRKLATRMRRPHVLGMYAGTAAIAEAGWLAEGAGLPEAQRVTYNDRSAIYVGAGSGAYQDQYDFLPLLAASNGDLRRIGAELAHAVPPMWLLQRLPNNALCHLGIQTGFAGPHACLISHGTSSVLAVAEACATLREGRADRAIAVAHEAPIEPQAIQGMVSLGLLAREAVRPFDVARDGGLLGEGAAAFALEREATASARGAAIQGEILGSSAATGGGDLFAAAPEGDAVVRAIHAALADAACSPDAVGMIVAYGEATRDADIADAKAIRRVFGEHMPPVTAFKWSIGHLGAAAGLFESTLALIALQMGEVPGIATLACIDPACAPLAVATTAQRPRGEVALVIARGLSDTAAALLLRSRRSAGSPAAAWLGGGGTS